jgi:hypothetical protein
MIEAKKLEVETLITQMENNPESLDVVLFENISCKMRCKSRKVEWQSTSCLSKK